MKNNEREDQSKIEHGELAPETRDSRETLDGEALFMTENYLH